MALNTPDLNPMITIINGKFKIVSNVQSGQPSVENDRSGAYFLKSMEVVANTAPINPAVLIKSLRVGCCFITFFYAY